MIIRYYVVDFYVREVKQQWANNEIYIIIKFYTYMFRAIDFFCGIGGNHIAFQEACAAHGLTPEVTLAFDLSPNCRDVYCSNHMCGAFHQKNIQSVSPMMLDATPVDLWMMSPPCQPHSRNGKQGDLEDPRSDGFVGILQILRAVTHKPRYLFLENVRDFATSKSRDELMACLKEVGLTHITEVLINPRDSPFCIPNSRLRYYCMATSVVPLSSPSPGPRTNPFRAATRATRLGAYLTPSITAGSIPAYCMIAPSALKKRHLMDIVSAASDHCCCFTKGYTRAVEGTGSVIDIEGGFGSEQSTLRYFSPREIANLLGFPATFQMDGLVTPKQQYGLLGNSVSVPVVASLLFDLIT